MSIWSLELQVLVYSYSHHSVALWHSPDDGNFDWNKLRICFGLSIIEYRSHWFVLRQGVISWVWISSCSQFEHQGILTQQTQAVFLMWQVQFTYFSRFQITSFGQIFLHQELQPAVVMVEIPGESVTDRREDWKLCGTVDECQYVGWFYILSITSWVLVLQGSTKFWIASWPNRTALSPPLSAVWTGWSWSYACSMQDQITFAFNFRMQPPPFQRKALSVDHFISSTQRHCGILMPPDLRSWGTTSSRPFDEWSFGFWTNTHGH